MRKIIPLIVLILLSAVFTKAQNFTQAEQKSALYTVEANKAAIGISADLISTSKVFYTYEDVATRIRYVSLQQTYKGIPVYNQILALSFRNDKLLSNFGTFDPSIEKSINVSSGVPSVTAESAVQSALSDRGFRASQMAIALSRKDQGRFIEFGNLGISRENITAQLSWVPNELTKTYNLAWQVYIIPKTTSDYWMVKVDAVNNSILGVDNYTDYDNWGIPNENPSINYPAFDYGRSISNNTNTATKNFFDFKKTEDPSLVTTASYRVVPLPAESPIHPGGAPALRTDPWLNAGVVANAVTLKWHTGAAAADYDYSRSNNVWSYEDRASTNNGSIASSASSQTAFPNLTFDFVPDFTQEPTVNTVPIPNQRWNITNLFYWNNIAHDVLYGYGFTEAGKNFQDDNLGRGGSGNDHVNAEAQDGSGTNNANFSTPADGGSGRMQMYLWTAPTPDRDGDVDNGIILHELGHGVSNRSNPGGTGCLGNAEQAGEGWSDYIGLMLTQNWATSTVASGFNSPRGIGTYALNQPINGQGIRPQRYCTDFTVNNATYSTLPSQVIPHGVGFVFCSALWELTWELINDPSTTGIDPNIYNFAGTGGNVVALRLVMEGLRTQQCQPGFISARNAIMRADTTLYGASHACAILRAFARRGMGVGAAEGSTSSITDQTVSFNGGGPSMTFTQSGAAGVPELQQIIYNHGVTAACSAITNFTLRDTLPLNVTFVSATNSGTYAAGTRVVSWPVNVALNATQNYGLTVQINAGTYFPPVVLINESVASTTISGFWATASAPAGNPWIAHNVRSKSAPNSFFTSNLGSTSDQTIATTANFAIGASAPNLSFWHWYNSEPSWDGGVLEISLDGGTSWSDIGAANFTQNGYNGNLNASANPLGGRAAWNGNSSAFVETKVNMTPYANQATAKLRWRFGSDGSIAATGWNVDDISMQTIAVVNMRTSLFNAATVRVSFNDTVTVILAGAAVPPTVTINQAAAQPDPTSVSPINFTVVFDQVVTGFATGDVALTGTAGATTGTITGSGTTYNVAVSGMTVSGTVIATVPPGVAVNATNDPNVASTSTDNTVTFNFIPPPACVSTIGYTGAPVAIPDATPAGVDIPLTVSGLGTITDLNFRLIPGAGTCDATAGNTNASVDHTFNGDLVFKLTSPAATTITLINRRGGSGNNFCLVTLDDDGSFPATSTMSTAGAVTGNFAPENPLSAFDGQSPNGTWILNVSDNAAVDVGSVRGFSLVITSAAPTVNPVANQTVCSGSPTAAVNFTSPTPGTTFSWVNNTPSIGLAASGTGNIASFTATNATATPVVATITVTPLLNASTTTTTFNFTGGAQTFTVPANVTSINFTALGAEGGAGAIGANNGGGPAGGAGGRGSRATGTLAVTPGQVLNIFVGGAGGTPTVGFNGGAAGGSTNAGGGGGASDVRFPGATTADRVITAAGGGGGGRGGCEGSSGAPGAGGAGGNGDGNGVNGGDSPTPGGVAGGGFGAIGTTFGGAGIGCGGFLGAPGLPGVGGVGGNGGAGQTCCCFSFGSVPGGGGGGGGQLGGGGGGGGSAGTTGCSGNDKGAGGGGAGGASFTGGVTAGVITTNIQTGNGQVILNYNVGTVCNGPTTSFTITVNPTPTVNAIPNQVVCQNAPTAPVNFTGTPVGAVFTWTNNTPAIGLAAAGTGNIPSFIAQNPGNTALVATITVTPVTGLATPIVTTYNFTGAVQTFTVPAGINSVNLKTWGAQGNLSVSGAAGGLGGYAEGNLTVVPGQVLNVLVGGGAASSLTGGFNGGGAGGTNPGCSAAQAGGGGGASDVRIAPYALANRVIVGAGGGGAGGGRVAGCGRGTGGGGGGGLYGGGGGSAWIGPSAGWTLATGGTQAAGGAGGTSTFGSVPGNNGLSGALAIGGAGGVEVNSNQAGTATGPDGGIGGGLTGGGGNHPGIGNFIGASGAGGSSYIGGVSGGITTAGLRSGAGQVQVTYSPVSSATCFGTQRTFTITVNPNANLIIVADPGTTLCEGDPTLLTVYDAGAVTGPGTLYTQGAGVPANGSPSQVFEPANAAFSSQGADDFTIPAGGNWNITQITANGIGTGAPTSVNVFFYTNSGSNLPGTAIASLTNITTFTRAGGNYTVTLPSALNLGAGTYWMSFQVNMSFAAGGQWFWGNFGTTNVGNQYAWQNPGGGFATPCGSWGYGATGCLVGGPSRNNIFSIVGTSVGLGPQSTGTFLWSPAAGLSSTTSNPVAASPMNTTTYTVTRTTVPGGCIASAQVTITVNKRPTVTTQPVSRTNCSGTTATFTVGGTGTALTYQWQVSTAGCAGPWVNVPIIAPYFGGTTPTLTITPTSVIMNGYAYRCVLSGTCPAINNANISNCAVLTVNPLPNITVTPPVSCGGVQGISGTLLTVTNNPTPVPGNVSVNSGVISVPIQDATNQAATSNLAVAGVPANATITEIKVNININHTWVGDVSVNLRAPNNAILNLVGSLNGGTGGNTTDDFINTTFSSIGTTLISGAPAPRTGTFAAEARAGFGPLLFVQTVNTWPGLVPTATPLLANGTWTLAMGDNVGGDTGTLTNWSISIDYTTPGTGPLPTLSYVWSPLAGLFNDPLSTIPYLGTNTATVYAAPTVQTTYTVTATNVGTGCTNTATALVNYTPPAPTVTPNPVTMCLGDPAVLLRSSSSTTSTVTFTSGTVSVAIPEGNFPTGPYIAGVSTIPVSAIPATANISKIDVKMNITHAFVGDVVAVLQAPNGQRLNLDALLNATNNAGANFVNTIISSAGTTALSAGTAPFTGTFKADAVGTTFTVFGFTLPGGPVGYIPTTSTWSNLYPNPNGNWTLALYDAGAPDLGTLTNWSMDITYVVGVQATPAVWTPIAGLFSNAAATTAYVAGTPVDSVWTRPTPAGVYNYQVTVQNVIGTNSTIATPMAGGNGNFLVAFNIRNNNLIPVTFSSIASNTSGSGAVVSRVFFKPSPIAGAPGPISVANGWTQFGTANNNVTAGTLNQLMSGLTLQIPAGATYGIALDMTGATLAYTNGGAIVTYSNGGCDLITGGNVGWGGPAAPGIPVNNPRNFNGSVVLIGSGPGTCTSPPRSVTVTVNQPTTVATQPVAQTVCTDKVATFTVTAGGTGPFSYRWQVSTNGNNPPWTFINNGGVYSGATTATLTITAPPLSMNGYFYRAVINGAAPCAADTSFGVRLTVNPLPTITISASPYTSLFPGLRTTLSSVVTPNAAATYTWLRNGIAVPGGTNATLVVDVDGLGDYRLRVTDINGCTNTSAQITIKDSISGKCFIYPNPTSGQFEVRYYSSFNDIAPRSLTIFDAKGDRVFTKLYPIGRAYQRMPVDMRAYGKGLYWVEISDVNGNRLTMCRVVIQ